MIRNCILCKCRLWETVALTSYNGKGSERETGKWSDREIGKRNWTGEGSERKAGKGLNRETGKQSEKMDKKSDREIGKGLDREIGKRSEWLWLHLSKVKGKNECKYLGQVSFPFFKICSLTNTSVCHLNSGLPLLAKITPLHLTIFHCSRTLLILPLQQDKPHPQSPP